MKYGNVYIAINESEVVFASEDREDANAFVDNKFYEARKAVLDEWGNDDPSEQDIIDAGIQVGIDGDNYEVVKVNISNKKSDEMVELDNGMEIEVSEILEKLK